MDRRLLHVDRLDLAEVRLWRGLERAPTELCQIAGAAHPRRRRREDRLRSEEVAQELLGLRIDLTNKERVRADLPAEVGQGGDDVGRAPHPLAVPLLIDRRIPVGA